MVFLLLQIITGIFLVMHYQPQEFLAFDSIVRLTNLVPYG
jgi:quinol-cytochrome oxidoreductase complex cytochrome b subunit